MVVYLTLCCMWMSHFLLYFFIFLIHSVSHLLCEPSLQLFLPSLLARSSIFRFHSSLLRLFSSLSLFFSSFSSTSFFFLCSFSPKISSAAALVSKCALDGTFLGAEGVETDGCLVLSRLTDWGMASDLAWTMAVFHLHDHTEYSLECRNYVMPYLQTYSPPQPWAQHAYSLLCLLCPLLSLSRAGYKTQASRRRVWPLSQSERPLLAWHLLTAQVKYGKIELSESQ